MFEEVCEDKLKRKDTDNCCLFRPNMKGEKWGYGWIGGDDPIKNYPEEWQDAYEKYHGKWELKNGKA